MLGVGVNFTIHVSFKIISKFPRRAPCQDQEVNCT